MSDLATRIAADPQNSGISFGISEIIRPQFKRLSNVLAGSRLNLVIPCISEERKSFGGPATALRLLDRMAPEFDSVRIVVAYETELQVNLQHWPDWVLDHGDCESQSIAFLGDRQAVLSVSDMDFFIATFWSTAVYVKHAVSRQAQWFPGTKRPFVYLIQEYEPAFYAGGARYEYAKSTYRDDGNVIAVFNSRPVTDYFRRIGVQFSKQYEFEPMFHPKLRKIKDQRSNNIKERLILVYGRPDVEQNGFDLIVEALRAWASEYPRVSEWSLVSAGLPHAHISLGENTILRSSGTLPLLEYAHLLSQCWAGLSFAFNASTSYSAREMAEFGAWVITNQFEYRKPPQVPPNIICVNEATPENIADRLAWCCDQYRPDKTAVRNELPPVFKNSGEEFPFVPDLIRAWGREDLQPRNSIISSKNRI